MTSLHRPATLLACLAAITLSTQALAQTGASVQDPQDDTLDYQLTQPRGESFADRDRVLSELRDTMSNLANLMDKHAMMNQLQLRTIAIVVKKLSLNLLVLSQPMASTSAAATLSSISERNRQLNATIDELQAQLNDN